MQDQEPKASRIISFQKLRREGVVQIILVALPAVAFQYNYNIAAIASAFFSIIILSAGNVLNRRNTLLFTISLAPTFAIIHQPYAKTILHQAVCYNLLATIFTKQTFFENAMFSLLLGQALRQQFSPLADYLIRCIFATLLFLAILSIARCQSHIKYHSILVGNFLMAAYALFKGLHFEILYSAQLIRLLFLSFAGILLMVMGAALLQKISLPRIIQRKIFHLPPLVLFPLLHSQAPDLLRIALIGAFYILQTLQFLRYFHTSKDILRDSLVPIWRWMQQFVDHRDRHLWVTHLSLFAGSMLTYFSSSTSWAMQNASVIIPIGDAMAAIIGSTFGRLKIFNKKSLEGSLAFLVSTTALFGLFGLRREELMQIQLPSILALLAVVELVSPQIDNLLLPCLFTVLTRY